MKTAKHTTLSTAFFSCFSGFALLLLGLLLLLPFAVLLMVFFNINPG